MIDDIEGAQKLGMKGILVKTGKYRPGDEEKISPPAFQVLPSFKEAVDYILQHMNVPNKESVSWVELSVNLPLQWRKMVDNSA